MGIASHAFLYDTRCYETNASETFRRKKKLTEVDSLDWRTRIQGLRGEHSDHRKIPLGPTKGIPTTRLEDDTSSSSEDEEFGAVLRSTSTITELLSRRITLGPEAVQRTSSSSSSSDGEEETALRATRQDSEVFRQLNSAAQSAKDRMTALNSKVSLGLRRRNNSQSDGK